MSDAVVGLRPYVEARSVSVFLSMPAGEVQTDAIVRHALAAGKHVFVPYLHSAPGSPPRLMDMVQLHGLSDYESLRPDRWGIPSVDAATVDGRRRVLGSPHAPRSGQPPLDLDLVLLPGVAFDIDPQTGRIRRCGHGKGFYDLFLARYAAARPAGFAAAALRAALCEQFLPPSSAVSVPVGPLDKPLDGLVLGDGAIREPADAHGAAAASVAQGPDIYT